MANLAQKADFKHSKIFVGIDVHLKSWSVTIFFEQQYLTTFTQPPDPLALKKYLFDNYPNAQYKCVYESGFCGFWIQRQLTNLGIECIVVNAADVPQTDKFAKSKSDKNDSKRLGLALQANLLTPIYISSEEVEADRQLVRTNERFNKVLTQSKNRVKGMLYQMGIKLPEKFAKNNWSSVFIQWLKSLDIKNSSLKLALSHQITMVEIVKAQKLAALKDIRSLLKKEKYNTISKYLLSIPGIGPYTAISLMTEVDEISRFSTFEKFNCFIGFYPSEFSSGEHIHKGNITGRKHNQLRSLLIEAAWVLVRTDPAMTLVYNQLKLDKGGKRAIVKIARKLLSRIRYVWMNQKPYVKGVIK